MFCHCIHLYSSLYHVPCLQRNLTSSGEWSLRREMASTVTFSDIHCGCWSSYSTPPPHLCSPLLVPFLSAIPHPTFKSYPGSLPWKFSWIFTSASSKPLVEETASTLYSLVLSWLLFIHLAQMSLWNTLGDSVYVLQNKQKINDDFRAKLIWFCILKCKRKKMHLERCNWRIQKEDIGTLFRSVCRTLE